MSANKWFATWLTCPGGRRFTKPVRLNGIFVMCTPLHSTYRSVPIISNLLDASYWGWIPERLASNTNRLLKNPEIPGTCRAVKSLPNGVTPTHLGGWPRGKCPARCLRRIWPSANDHFEIRQAEQDKEATASQVRHPLWRREEEV